MAPDCIPIEMWRGLGDIAIVWLTKVLDLIFGQTGCQKNGGKRQMLAYCSFDCREPRIFLNEALSTYPPELITLASLSPSTGVRKYTLSSSSDEEDIEQSCDGNKVLQKCLNGSFDSSEQEIGKCLNGASDTPKELVDSDVKHPANTNGRYCMESQTDSEGEPRKCMNEEPGVSLEAICSKVQLAPNETGECCMNSQADSPTSPVANSGQSPQFITNEQSSPPSFKKLKTSSVHASVKPTGTMSEATMKLQELVNKINTSSEHVSVRPTGTVSEATMKLQELVNKIRRAQDLLQSVDYAPSSIKLAHWKFQENNPWPKRN
uniref:Uncharacterized protein n=1 Tax=Aegilops tauschii TaxID=37682 RepID=M8BWV9_AEGTA